MRSCAFYQYYCVYAVNYVLAYLFMRKKAFLAEGKKNNPSGA